ncbi:MAG: nucleotidyltransferase family protein [Bacteroidales bacterium]|nr:nucleotidyltransferase family protein [Bacteroidales bacterium]
MGYEPSIKEIEPEILKEHHRLTARQINSLLGEGCVKEMIEEKLGALGMVSEFLAVTDALRSAGIRFIPLKGPLLAHKLYGDATARQYGDIDILVDSASLNSASRVLIKKGYQPPSTNWLSNEKQEGILQKHTVELAFVNPSTQTVFELHWRLLRVPVVNDGRLREIINANLQEYSFSDREFTILSNELELLFLVIHGGWHWWHRLKWLVDINDYIGKHQIDWKKFEELSLELKAESMVALCNEMLQEHFPGSRQLPVQTRAKRFMVQFCRRRIASHSEPIHDFYGRAFGSVWYALISFPGLTYKLKRIRSYLFVASLYGKNKVLSWLPFFYVYGPVKLLAARAKG